MDRQRRRLSQALLAAAGLLVLPGTALARPDMTRTMGTTLADTDGPDNRERLGYRFESRVFPGSEGHRRHRVWLAIPESTPPSGGFPCLYLLDGNAVLSRLRVDWLTALQAGTPPVLVMIGYDTDLLFDGEARHYDYTPAPEGQTSVRDASRPQREGGGAAAFLQRIESTIIPWVMDTTPINPDRNALWGHSFGGLFTLFTLCTRPNAFQTYLPVSPSVGWADNLLRQSLDHLAAQPPERNTPVWLCRGDNEVRVIAEVDAEQLRRRKQQGNATFNRFADDLDRIPRVEAHRRLYPGLGHGDMFSAALPEALRLAAGLAPTLGWS